jgi:hypothetical protein
MHSAGARAVREDDNEMSREAVLLQWERKIEAAERLEEQPAPEAEPDYTQQPRPRRFQRVDGEGAGQSSAAPAEPVATATATAPEPAAALASVAERRTVTITGQPTPARRRRPVVDAQLAQPDRVALWAFLLGLLLVAVAAGTAHV